MRSRVVASGPGNGEEDRAVKELIEKLVTDWPRLSSRTLACKAASRLPLSAIYRYAVAALIAEIDRHRQGSTGEPLPAPATPWVRLRPR
jgi:hypothetical protein